MAKLWKSISLTLGAWGVFVVRERKLFVYFRSSATFAGHLHCLADAVEYAGLEADDMDIDVTGCLVYGKEREEERLITTQEFRVSGRSIWRIGRGVLGD